MQKTEIQVSSLPGLPNISLFYIIYSTQCSKESLFLSVESVGYKIALTRLPSSSINIYFFLLKNRMASTGGHALRTCTELNPRCKRGREMPSCVDSTLPSTHNYKALGKCPEADLQAIRNFKWQKLRGLQSQVATENGFSGFKFGIGA